MLESQWGSPSPVEKRLDLRNLQALITHHKMDRSSGAHHCFHGNQLLSGISVPLLHLTLEHLRGKASRSASAENRRGG